LTPILTPLIDSRKEDVAKFEDETLHQVVKWASSDRIDDIISPDDSVAVEMTIDEVSTSTAAEVNEIRSESVLPKPEPKYQYSGNQWSPLNPRGKKQYDRNFLLKLQYEPTSMTRPINLPALSDISPMLKPFSGEKNSKSRRNVAHKWRFWGKVGVKTLDFGFATPKRHVRARNRVV